MAYSTLAYSGSTSDFSPLLPRWILAPLGSFYNNIYYIIDHQNCLAFLQDHITHLKCDDINIHSHRRALFKVNILHRDLKHILLSAGMDHPEIFRLTVKLLAELTTDKRVNPFEVCELTKILCDAREIFLDSRVRRAVVDHLKRLFQKRPLSVNDKESISDSLLLILNVLKAPEVTYRKMYCDYCGGHPYDNHASYIKNHLIFFIGRDLEWLLINFMSCPQRDEWMLTVKEIITIIHNDQSAEDILHKFSNTRG